MQEWYLIVDLAPTLPIRFVNLSYGLRKDTIGVDFSTQRRASFSKRKQLFKERARYRRQEVNRFMLRLLLHHTLVVVV